MRSLVRWSSLAASAAALWALGAARFHHQNFSLFLAILLGLTVITLVVFLVTEESS